MDQNGHPKVAHAHPSKAFFVDMLTRDISLTDCILDLIDNSINSLIAKNDLDVLQHLMAGTHAPRVKASIDILFSPAKFSIKDTCPGIPIADAEDQVFLLGNPNKDKTHSGLGVYGIGMKRAFFKMGRKISISSNTTTEEFKIDINVDEWEKTKEWDFPFTDAKQKKSAVTGTSLEVTKLDPVVSTQFGLTTTKNILLERISTAYALFLKAGLTVKVNSTPAVGDIPELAESKNLRLVRQQTKKDGVDILIMAGTTPAADRTPRGWYVFCNGRLVLDGDKTDRTGWGLDNFPIFHSKYNHFLGYVYFRSKDVRKLPWTTTKEGVLRESPVYQAALADMRAT